MHQRALVIAPLGVLLVGCAHAEPNIAPAEMARQAGHVPQAAIAEDRGVEVIAQADGWPPGAAPRGDLGLTPFKVWIHNGSARPLQVRMQSFVLSAADGTDYRALPALAGAGADRVIERAAFEHSGFKVAPQLAAHYPGLAPFDGAFFHPPGYALRHADSAAVRALPERALRHVLPEGVLSPDGRLAGYVLFESPSESDLDKGNLAFRVEFSELGLEPVFARVSIPFADDDR